MGGYEYKIAHLCVLIRYSFVHDVNFTSSFLTMDTHTEREDKIAQDKLAKYKGSAQVSITHLDFPHPCRQVDRRIVEQLKKDFEGQGCMRHSNRVPAIIDDSILETALGDINTQSFRTSSTTSPPKLHFGDNVKLECLHGQHRVLAAEEFFAPRKRWWIVDFYATGELISQLHPNH